MPLSSCFIRALDPKTELPLFEQSYNWRSKPRKNRLSFEDFAKDDPSQITLGLFNGELQAVYFFHQIGPNQFQVHFTSKRTADRKLVLAGAATLVRWFQENNLEMVAYIHRRNIPLQVFAQEAGLRLGDTGSSDVVIFSSKEAQQNTRSGFSDKSESGEGL